MQETIQLFSEKTTRDELGLGLIRDVFADQFFPGMSTIQTRVKYFLFVPWTYQILERKKISPSEIVQRARRLEVDLINSLISSGDSLGTIGRIARENVQRLPSSVYWQGLLIWGLRVFEGSQEEYHDRFGQFHLRLHRHHESRPEIDEDSLGSPPGNWHTGLPPMPEGFPKNQTFDLSETESIYLKERILESCPESLLAELLRHPQSIEDIHFPWELKKIPSKLHFWLDQGKLFSFLMHGAPLLYNLLLAERSLLDNLQESYREDLRIWWQELPPGFVEWDLRQFWELVYLRNPKISRRTQQFVETWARLVRSAKSVEQISDDPVARRLIEERELQLKGKLSRFSNDRVREIWAAGGGAAGTGWIDFRWGPAKRHLTDLYHGMGAKS